MGTGNRGDQEPQLVQGRMGAAPRKGWGEGPAREGMNREQVGIRTWWGGGGEREGMPTKGEVEQKGN